MTNNNDTKPAEPQAEAPKRAIAMSIEERAAFLREHSKQFPAACQNIRLPRKSPYAN